MYKRSILTAMTLAAISTQTLAEDTQVQSLDAFTVIGSKEAARGLPGSAAYIDNEQINTEAATDIHQLMKTVPGVYVREEEGLGLRPNIGIRAAAPGRSSNITLMEDGVLIAPAPYSNPAAYYFPTTMRMDSIEILKGAPLLRYGPQTVGGAVNMVSTPIPETNRGRARFTLNDEGSTDALLSYGGKEGDFGYMFETVQRNNQGFKDIDRSSQDTGFEIQDYVGKLSWEGDRNKVLLKFQRSFEESDQTYAGLTDRDFDRDEERLYGLTEVDNMDNDHTGINLTHEFQWTDNLTSTVTAYHNEFARNWFKFDGENPDTGNNIIDDANGGNADAQAILDGRQDVAGLVYKNNNREYESRGVQTNFNWLAGAHDINFGARVHYDEMDRFQPVENFDQVSGQLVSQGVDSAVSGSNNREEEADALSLWVTDAYQVTDRLLLNMSLRMEDVDTQRKQYGNTDRTQLEEKRSNDYREYLAGIAATYDLTDNWQVLAGFHEGMIPLSGGAEDGDEPGTSDNYELGLRYQSGVFFGEAIAFYSDFANLVENCSIGSPCSNDATSGSFSVGGAEVRGMEMQVGTLFSTENFAIPVDLSYTYTEAETTSGDEFQSGDQLQGIPEHMFSARVGLEHASGWDNYAVFKYIDETCVSTGCNRGGTRFDKTDPLAVVDLISRYRLAAGPEVFLKAENVFDRQEIISRDPFGARPNLGRTVTAGIEIDF